MEFPSHFQPWGLTSKWEERKEKRVNSTPKMSFSCLSLLIHQLLLVWLLYPSKVYNCSSSSSILTFSMCYSAWHLIDSHRVGVFYDWERERKRKEEGEKKRVNRNSQEAIERYIELCRLTLATVWGTTTTTQWQLFLRPREKERE